LDFELTYPASLFLSRTLSRAVISLFCTYTRLVSLEKPHRTPPEKLEILSCGLFTLQSTQVLNDVFVVPE